MRLCGLWGNRLYRERVAITYLSMYDAFNHVKQSTQSKFIFLFRSYIKIKLLKI